jgi:hypothetical protein
VKNWRLKFVDGIFVEFWSFAPASDFLKFVTVVIYTGVLSRIKVIFSSYCFEITAFGSREITVLVWRESID